MDFIEGLPRSEGVDTILVVVDRLTKHGHFLTLRYPFTTLKVAELFVKEVVRLHGFPTPIVSDQDKVFMSIFWRELLDSNKLVCYEARHFIPKPMVNWKLSTKLWSYTFVVL